MSVSLLIVGFGPKMGIGSPLLSVARLRAPRRRSSARSLPGVWATQSFYGDIQGRFLSPALL